MTTISYKVGQEWSYQTRENEEESTLVITKIDENENSQNIVHIFVKGLKMKNSLSKTGFNDHIVHLPYEYTALKECTTDLIGTVSSLPNFKDGYVEWLKMFENGKAGVFQIPLSETIDFIEQHFN